MSTRVLDVDLLIAGSGAGGMTAALAAHGLGLRVAVVEKSEFWGGSTARSGGNIWVPNCPTLVAEGCADAPDDLRTYLRSEAAGRASDDRIDAFLDAAPRAFAFLAGQSPHLRFQHCRDYPDYHPERPGGSCTGRAIEPLPFDLRRLGRALATTIQPPGIRVPMGLWATTQEVRDLAMITRTPGGRRMALRMAGRFVRVLTGSPRVALGRSLAGRLRLALLEAGVPVLLGAPIEQLVITDDRVVGAYIGGSDPLDVRCRGVVLATGGFDHAPLLRELHHAMPGWSAGAATNTGDGHLIGQEVGGAVALMDEAWWMPALALPDGEVRCLVVERVIPSSLIVNERAQRFTNESKPYGDFVRDQRAQSSSGDAPVWFICDAAARRRYQFASVLPGQPFPRSWYRAGIVHKADSVPALAASVGLPVPTLVETVGRFNAIARCGKDIDFGRGDSAYDRYYGDPGHRNPCFAPLGRGPYYAIRIVPGDLGTKGGLVTDVDARVLRADGTAVEGLWATGNVAASVMGDGYAGAGATIGPAMVFGYLAACDAARRIDSPSVATTAAGC